MKLNERAAYLLPLSIFLIPEQKISLLGFETFFAALVLPTIELSLSVYFFRGMLKKTKNHAIYFGIVFSLFCAELLYILTTYWDDRLASSIYQLSILIYLVFALFLLYFLGKCYWEWITQKTFFSLAVIATLYFIATVYYMNPLVSRTGIHASIDIVYNMFFSAIFAFAAVFSIRENNISHFAMLHGILLISIAEFGIHYYNYFNRIGNYAIFFEKVWAFGILSMFVSFFDRRFLLRELAPFKSIRTASVFLVQLFLTFFILIIVFSKFLSITNTASFGAFLLTIFVIWFSANATGFSVSKMLLRKSREIHGIKRRLSSFTALDGPLYHWVCQSGNQTVFYEFNRLIEEYNALTRTMMENYSGQNRFNIIGRISECAISDLNEPLKKIRDFLMNTEKGERVSKELLRIESFVDNMREVLNRLPEEYDRKNLLNRQIRSLVNDYLLVKKKEITPKA